MDLVVLREGHLSVFQEIQMREGGDGMMVVNASLGNHLLWTLMGKGIFQGIVRETSREFEE